MMNTFKYEIEIGTRAYCEKTSLDRNKLFYKNGTPKGKGLLELIKRIELDFVNLTASGDYDYYRDYKQALTKINKDSIKITFDWEEMNFGRSSNYENVYFFERYYQDEVLRGIQGYLFNMYGLIVYLI